MAKFSLHLPFFVTLGEGKYILQLRDRQFTLSHAIVQQSSLDPRLGGIHGEFGFIRDHLGLARFSRLEAELTEDDLESISQCLLGVSFITLRTLNSGMEGQAALALFNEFLERYRVATRNLDVRSIGHGEPASLYMEDEHITRHVRLYGGGITLPVVGLTPEYQERVVGRLAEYDSPPLYELNALQALQAMADGAPNEALLMAAGALELATDIYLARSWRLGKPPIRPKDAASEIGIKQASDVRTIDDVLEKGPISAKIKKGAITSLVADTEAAADLEDALEVRNLVVHSGVRVPAGKARRHVEAMANFVLDHLNPAIQRDYPLLPRHEFLYAYEEAMGTELLPKIEQVVNRYLVGAGLAAKLYSRKAKRQNMFSERYGDTLVMRIAFGDFERYQVNLFIAQSLLHHWLENQGVVAFARVSAALPDERTRAFWSRVASEMTRTVWMAAIDNHLLKLGFEEIVQKEITRQEGELMQRYSGSYITPAFEQLGFWIDYLEIARIAAMLPPSKKAALSQRIASVAPHLMQTSSRAIPAIERANFDDPDSILATLIAVHDAHESILATVPIYDPVKNEELGLGLSFGDLGKIIEVL